MPHQSGSAQSAATECLIGDPVHLMEEPIDRFDIVGGERIFDDRPHLLKSFSWSHCRPRHQAASASRGTMEPARWKVLCELHLTLLPGRRDWRRNDRNRRRCRSLLSAARAATIRRTRRFFVTANFHDRADWSFPAGTDSSRRQGHALLCVELCPGTDVLHRAPSTQELACRAGGEGVRQTDFHGRPRASNRTSDMYRFVRS